MKHSIALICTLLAAVSAQAVEPDGHRVLLIVLDGLRPDYITPEVMPNLYALSERGVFCENHHAVFPTVTRVNSSSISTGSYPATHGLMGNSVFFPDVSQKGLSTSDPQNLLKIDKATDNQLLTATTLGEVVEQAGDKVMVFSSGSGGSAFLLNHRLGGGGVINTGFITPETMRAEALDRLGPAPEDAIPDIGQHRWVVDAYIQLGLDTHRPLVSLMWLSDPDTTAHKFGPGAPETIEAIRLVDGELGRILAAHDERGLTDNVDIFVTSDHGFSTYIGGANPLRPLIENGFKKSAGSTDVVLVGGALHFDKPDDAKVRGIVNALQAEDWVGALFTRAIEPGSDLGFVPGTLSFDSIGWNHERAGDLLIDVLWTDVPNEHGFKGVTTNAGVAGHGSSSPWDIHNTLIAAGPSFRKKTRSPVPTVNVDFAPTICRMLDLDPPETMTGRAMVELLNDGPEPGAVNVTREQVVAEADNYRVTLHRSIVEGHRYLDFTKTTRPDKETADAR